MVDRMEGLMVGLLEGQTEGLMVGQTEGLMVGQTGGLMVGHSVVRSMVEMRGVLPQAWRECSEALLP